MKRQINKEIDKMLQNLSRLDGELLIEFVGIGCRDVSCNVRTNGSKAFMSDMTRSILIGGDRRNNVV